jgi:hypothetical protein
MKLLSIFDSAFLWCEEKGLFSHKSLATDESRLYKRGWLRDR